jgi:hypothetical protein
VRIGLDKLTPRCSSPYEVIHEAQASASVLIDSALVPIQGFPIPAARFPVRRHGAMLTMTKLYSDAAMSRKKIRAKIY